MKPERVDQLVAGFVEGDAISMEAIEIRDLLRECGFKSDIYAPADRIGEVRADRCQPVRECMSSTGDVLILHYSIESGATHVFEKSRARKVIRYHNITPDSFFVGFDDSVAAQLRNARKKLTEVAGLADLVLAVSDYNASEVKALGIQNVKTLPLIFRFDRFNTPPDPAYLARYSGPLKNILFVGRMVPNKCIEDLLMAFAWLNKCIDPATRLILVGSDQSCPHYYAMLRMLAGRLGLANAAFEGSRSETQLVSCYRSAHLFVCASRHEGFCQPLVEAMVYGVPVMARAIGEMPQTMNGSGVLYDDMDERQLAELMHRLLVDKALRDTVLASQSRRRDEIRNRDTRGELLSLITG